MKKIAQNEMHIYSPIGGKKMPLTRALLENISALLVIYGRIENGDYRCRRKSLLNDLELCYLGVNQLWETPCRISTFNREYFEFVEFLEARLDKIKNEYQELLWSHLAYAG